MAATWKKLAYEEDVVTKALFDAYSILAADTDNTPAAITLAASQLIGRKATGGIVALPKADILTIINVEDGADVTDAENVSAAGAIMGTLFAAKGDLIGASADDTPAILSVGTNGQFLKALSTEATGLIWAAPSVAEINDIGDVVIDTPADDEVLAYDNGTSKWINQTPAEADLATATDLTTHEGVKAANAVLGHVIVETASLIDVDGDGKLTLTPSNIALDDIGNPDAAVGFAGEQAEDLVVHTVADEAARDLLTPVVGKLAWLTDPGVLHICTASE